MRLPVVAVAAALAIPLAACGNGSSSGGGTPPPLALAAAGAADLAAPAAAGVKGNGGYRLSGSLPSGIPAPAHIRELSRGPVDRDAVTRLTSALQVGHPRRIGASWTAGSKLSVRDDTGQPWSYGQDVAVCSPPAAADQAVGCTSGSAVVTAAPGTSSGSGSGTSGRTVAPPPKPLKTIAAATAKTIATTVFNAAGVGSATTHVGSAGDGGVYVTADPIVSGLQTSGFTTSVTVGNTGRVLFGNGWLATTSEGPAYPLISARAAFEQLKMQPRPLAADMPCQIGKSCGMVEQVVTGATLGLSLQYRDNGRPVLVPSWLFSVVGLDQPIAQVAVEPRYLPGPSHPATEPTGKPSSVDPGPPTSTVPNPRPSSYTVSSDGRTLTVEYSVGVCPKADYVGTAKESATSITVIITAENIQPMDPDTACIELAQIKHTPVTLQAPLGSRPVRDEDGSEIQNLND
ncbi:MAG: hypothetical protein QOG53_3388 [Frankiales bacterium]|jgi:hypothetical protein|nr:hypothetical protein [Frankiales bacterium]